MSLLSTSNLNKTQDTLSKIDGILTAIEKYPDGECQGLNVSLNPFELLLLLLKMFGVTKEELIQFFTILIKYELPTIELGMKGIILAHLKQMVDCTIDPRIPIWARDNFMEDKSTFDENVECSGMTFDMTLIDVNSKLSTNPFSYPKNTLFFGIDSETTPYDLIRAKDFDAFLWLVTHKKFPNHVRVNGIEDLENKYSGTTEGNPSNLLDVVKLVYDPNKQNCGILPGATFMQTIGNNGDVFNSISVCKNAKRNESNKIVSNELYPIGAYYDRLTWYVNRSHYFDFMFPNNGREKKHPRDYNKDIGLCTFKYIDDVADNTMKDDSCAYLKNQLNVKILPKPLIHTPRIGQQFSLPIKILFNKNGEADKNGRFSVKSLTNNTYNASTKTMNYTIVNQNNQTAVLKVNEYGAYNIEGGNIQSFLYECYPNLTVYEFNYDYIFGMQLLEPKTVMTQLINSLTKINIGFGVEMTNVSIEKQKIVNIVKKIVEANDYESSDCFFNFSNDEIDKMSRESELQRSQNIPFGDGVSTISQDDIDKITDLLNEFNDSATLESSTDIMKRTIEQVSATIEQPYDSSNVKYSFNTTLDTSFIEDLIKNLSMVLIDAILSPKVILMLAINQKLMGQFDKDQFEIKVLLNKMIGLVTSMVKEIRDLILQKLLDFVMKKIVKLLVDLNAKLFLEQLMVYRGIIKRLINDCFDWGSSLNNSLVTELDKVDYADIDDTKSQPKTDKC